MEYDEYIKLVDKYYKNDCRECNFQNRIIIPFLESIAEEFDVVDVSTLYRNWKGISREKFADQYTPDVLVTRHWELGEVNKEKPLLIVEVKTPKARDRVHAEKEIEEYLKKSNVVILTNCIAWEIYDNRKHKDLYMLETTYSQDYKGKRIQYPTDVCCRWENDEHDIKWNKDADKWNDLITKLINILRSKN